VNRVSGVLLGLSAVLLVSGVALYSPRLSVIVAALCVATAGVANLDIGGRP
jgi:uncharacterized iron-regulated membrane protein